MKKVYIESSSRAYEALFASLGFAVVSDFVDVDLVCFTGGADVSAYLYGDKQHPKTYNDPFRDAKEQRLFEACRQLNIPVVGICRGGQFLNVMSGGRMYQHVSKHGMSHHLIDSLTGDTIYVTSTHHQMMMPSKEAEVVAFSTLGGTREWVEQGIIELEVSEMDYEVVFYKHTQALCFQPHPEMNQGSAQYAAMQGYFKALLKRYFNLGYG